MQTQKYTCRHCGNKTSSFNCSCEERSKEKNLWDKSQRKSKIQKQSKII